MEEYMMCAQLMQTAEYIQRLAWQVFSGDRRERERAAQCSPHGRASEHVSATLMTVFTRRI